MTTDWGSKPLLILPFDHRGTFLKKLFGITDRKEFTDEEAAEVRRCKWMVYQGFLKALESGELSAEEAAILIDEQFGERIIEDAKARAITVAVSCEKSGQHEFDFEHGPAYQERIEAIDPALAKVLVRYNVEGDQEANRRQAERLARLSESLAGMETGYLFELLVPPTEEQLARGQEAYDRELRPGLMVRAIEELHERGVEPDVWKLEGVETTEDAEAIVAAVRAGDRDAGVIILGRGADDAAVEHWLRVGRAVEGATGFAVGRTIFWKPLERYHEGELSEEEAAAEVADNYLRFVRVWKGG